MSSQLLDLAARLTREAGHPPTLAGLAAAAGVSRATVYRAFANHEGLLEQLRARGVEVPEDGRVVFDAVRGVLLDSGLDGFSVDAVARRAGVSVATLHRRFDGRDGLLLAFFDQLAPRTEAWRLVEEGDPVETLAGFATQVSAWVVRDARLLLAALSASAATRDRLGRLRATTVGTHDALAGWLARRGELLGVEVPEPLRAARAFLGAVLGMSAAGPLTAEQATWWARGFLRGLELA